MNRALISISKRDSNQKIKTPNRKLKDSIYENRE